MLKEEQKFVAKAFWMKGWSPTKVHEESMVTIVDDTYRSPLTKGWL
jgi:hypothetical protein